MGRRSSSGAADALRRADVRGFRRARAKSESPRGLVWVGLALLLLTILNRIVGLLTWHAMWLHASISIILWTAAFLISRTRFAPAAVPALVGLCTLVVTAEFEYEVWVNPTPLGYGYVLMIMLAGAPLLLSPFTWAVVATASVAGAVAIGYAEPWVLGPGNAADWVIAAATAEVVGGLLLMLRLRSIDELGTVSREAVATATHDSLTGLLNRRGMEAVLPGIVGHASRARRDLWVCFVDIDWLKTANDAHGHDFGDAVIRCVAEAVVAAAPRGTAVARWGGDEFLLVNEGEREDDDVLAARIANEIAASGIDLAKWPGAVSVGSASAKATGTSLAELIAAADEHMYARRRTKRG